VTWIKPAWRNAYAKRLLVTGAILVTSAVSGCGWVSGAGFWETVAYDRVGRVAERTTAGGRTTTYRYDGAGRLSETAWGGDKVQVSYDGAGNVARLRGPSGDALLSWDSLNRLSAFRDARGRGIAYEYDPWGRVISATPSGGSRIEYERDVIGRIVSVSDGHGLLTFDYTPEAVVRTLPSGVRSLFRLDSSGRLATLRHESRVGELLAEYVYTRDGSGRIASINEASPSGSARTSFEYDAMGRLAQIVPTGGSGIVFEYDAAGNRVRESGAGGVVVYRHRKGVLESAGGSGFEHDRDGNRTAVTGVRTLRYEWDAAGRLVSITGGRVPVRYAYDAAGNLTMREVGATKTWFVRDVVSGNAGIAAEYGDDGGLVNQYVSAAGQPLGVRSRDGATRYFLEDHLGSVRIVVDEQGAVTERRAYAPFGRPRTKAWSGPGFSGAEWDDDVGLLRLGSRFLDPDTGTFLSRDRFPGLLDEPRSFNRYAYAYQDPVNLVDPSGFSPQSPDYAPSTRELQGWWNVWAERQLILDRGGFFGMSKAAFASFEYAFLEKYAKPIEEGVRKLSDPVYTAAHPAWKFVTGIKLAADVAGLVPLSPADQVFKVSFARRVPLPERFSLINPSNTGTATRTFLPFGLDRAYPASKVLRFSINKASDVKDLATESADLVKQLVRDFSGNPFDSPAARPVGGVRLDRAALFHGNLGALTGATYDPDTGRIVLLADRQTALPPVRAGDLAVALRGVFGGGDVSMTIDPDPRNPRGPTMNVVYFGGTSGTQLGLIMFEADRMMKGLSAGKDNVSGQPLAAHFPAFASLLDLGLRRGNGARPQLWNRFWLVPERVELLASPDGGTVQFGETTMRVKTETMRWAGPRLVPAGGEKDPDAEQFAALLTANYEELAREFPVYGELKRVAQVVALARWMKEAGVPVDPRWMDPGTGGGAATPETTPSVANEVSEKRGRVTRTVSAFGGVDLAGRPSYVPAPALGAVRAAIRGADRPEAAGHAFELSVAGRTYNAIEMPSGSLLRTMSTVGTPPG